MIHRVLGHTPVQVLYKGIEGTRARGEAIADNLANISTPGYKRKVVRFEEELAAALEQSRRPGRPQPGGWQSLDPVADVRPEITLDVVSGLRGDGNTVDIDSEAAALAMNTDRFMAMVEILNREYRTLHQAIRETVG
jgi:flagellar basal-body rod protein FlgB